eukprot:gene14727-biopygen17122
MFHYTRACPRPLPQARPWKPAPITWNPSIYPSIYPLFHPYIPCSWSRTQASELGPVDVGGTPGGDVRGGVVGEQEGGAGVARAWRGRGAGYRHVLAWGGAGVARAWRGHGAGMARAWRGHFLFPQEKNNSRRRAAPRQSWRVISGLFAVPEQRRPQAAGPGLIISMRGVPGIHMGDGESGPDVSSHTPLRGFCQQGGGRAPAARPRKSSSLYGQSTGNLRASTGKFNDLLTVGKCEIRPTPRDVLMVEAGSQGLVCIPR